MKLGTVGLGTMGANTMGANMAEWLVTGRDAPRVWRSQSQAANLNEKTLADLPAGPPDRALHSSRVGDVRWSHENGVA